MLIGSKSTTPLHVVIPTTATIPITDSSLTDISPNDITTSTIETKI